MTDFFLTTVDNALRTLFAKPRASRPAPRADAPTELSGADRERSGGLMRVNHVGEVCAQALYQAQALSTRDPALKRHFEQASRDETDHLAWTSERLRELGSRESLLNPLWYAGSFALGLIAGRQGDRISLGFVVETERQVEQHLDGHLSKLPEADLPSRAIVVQMMRDEAAHAASAAQAGATELPWPVRLAMRGAARVMTTTARYV